MPPALGRSPEEVVAAVKVGAVPVEVLDTRVRTVLELVAKGNHNREIASTLGISPRTVEVHRARVMEKLHAQSVSELVHIVLNASQPINDGLPTARE